MFATAEEDQTQPQSLTSQGLDFFFGEDWISKNWTSSPNFDLHILDEKSAILIEVIPLFEAEKPKKKLKGWGLFSGLRIDDEEIEAAKKSLFPNRDF